MNFLTSNIDTHNDSLLKLTKMGAQQCGITATARCGSNGASFCTAAQCHFYVPFQGWLLSTWSQGGLAAPQRPDTQTAKGVVEVRTAARHNLVERVYKLLQVAAQVVLRVSGVLALT